MAKHRHYDKIVAKAENLELVVFCKAFDAEWVKRRDSKIVYFSEEFEYFLCLPEHNENGQCLHWLNGGELQDFFEGSHTSVGDYEGETWIVADNPFMNEEYSLRIKPKKEKRWITYSNNQKRLGVLSFDSEQEARAHQPHYIHEVDESQFIEIEVEV